MNMLTKKVRYLILCCMTAALGGLLFGYDWVVIGGAKPFYEAYFNISDNPGMSAWAMSSALSGCVIGAVISGLSSERYGRKKTLIFSAFLFLVSAIGTALIHDFNAFIIYRIIGGIGIGLAAAVSPMYIAEMSPPKERGKYVALQQLSIVIGILAAQLINLAIAMPVPMGSSIADIAASWNGQLGWRYMFGAGIVPAALFFILMFFIPESPRWLVKKGNAKMAESVLARVFDKNEAQLMLTEIHESFEHAASDLKFKFSRDFFVKYRKVFFIGLVLPILMQWTGINIVFNYAQEVFYSAGFDINDTLRSIVATGSVNLIFTLVAFGLVDRIGRRYLSLIGYFGLSVLFFILAYCFYVKITGIFVLILILSAIALYATAVAPSYWIIMSEVFPNKIRGIAIAMATTILWIANFFLAYTFPFLNASFGAAGSFLLYAVICLLGFIFVSSQIPETKGETLELIERKLVG